ncbi:MAG: hypothetical protein AAF916_01410 [Planctomycetota bacterium]
MRLIPTCVCVAVSAAVAVAATGQSALQHVDALPYALDGKIEVGRFDFGDSGTIAAARVFAEPLESIQPSYHGVNAPGFFNTADFPLLPFADFSFDLPAITGPVSPDQPRNALYWGGTGDVAFGDLPAGHGIQARASRFVTTTADGGSSDTPGFVMVTTGESGTIHEHISFRARGDNGGAPDDGLYLLPLRLHQPGLESSDVLYLLFNGKYERDENDEIIFDGFVPRVDQDAQALAEAYLEALVGGVAPGLAGDYNGSGSVEQGDLNLVLNDWGGPRPGDWANADGLTSPSVDQEELNLVLNNWGASSAPSFAGSTIPEPTGLLTLGLFASAALRRRR